MPIPKHSLTHWKSHSPQAVPRGFLRTYILAVLSRHLETGYSIMHGIEEKTGGNWRPGPGTIYPLLRKLAKEGLINPVPGPKEKARDSVTYSLSKKGKLELEEMQQVILAHSEKREGMMTVFAELLPATRLVPMLLDLLEPQYETLLSKISELPSSQRKDSLLRFKRILRIELSKIASKR